MTELFVSAFITLFVVIDPPGCAPIYAGLTKDATSAQARNMALRATAIAAAILTLFAFFGEQLLNALHIELDSFRIAGGLMLFFIAFEMVFESAPSAAPNARKGSLLRKSRMCRSSRWPCRCWQGRARLRPSCC